MKTTLIPLLVTVSASFVAALTGPPDFLSHNAPDKVYDKDTRLRPSDTLAIEKTIPASRTKR